MISRFAAIAWLALAVGCGPVPVQTTASQAATTVTPSAAPTSAAPVSAITSTPDEGVTIGESVQGRPIKLYQLGSGPVKLVLVGGIHGGYEGNTIALAYELIDHYRSHTSARPGATLLIVPDANPDGLAAFGAAGGSAAGDVGRVNARGVDLNRNWGCIWQPSGQWQGGRISAGSAPFSEPETRALRDLITQQRPSAVVFWHSALGAVYGGGCGSGSAFDAGKSLALAYAEAAGYAHGRTFGGYPITGDAANWVSRLGIPALAVELSTHTSTELGQNLAGVSALIRQLAAQ